MLKRFIAGLTVCLTVGVIGLKMLTASATGATLNKFDIHTDSKKNQVQLTIYVDQKADIETSRKGNVYTLKLKNAQISQTLVDKGLPVVIDNENKLLARAVPLKEGGAKIIIPNMPKESYQVTINQKARRASASDNMSSGNDAQAFSQIATYTEHVSNTDSIQASAKPTVNVNQFKGPDPFILEQARKNSNTVAVTPVVRQQYGSTPLPAPKVLSQKANRSSSGSSGNTMVAMADPATEFNQKHGQLSVVPFAETVLSQKTQGGERNSSSRASTQSMAAGAEQQKTFSFLDPQNYQSPSGSVGSFKVKPMIGKRPLPYANPKIDFLNTESQFEKIASRFPKPRVEPNSRPMVTSTDYQGSSAYTSYQTGSYMTPNGALVMNNPFVSPPQQQAPISALYFEEDNKFYNQPQRLNQYSSPSINPQTSPQVNPWYVNEADQTMLAEEDAYTINDIPDLSQVDMVASEEELAETTPQTWVQEIVSAVKSLPMWVFVLLALFFGGIGLFALAGAVLMARLMYQSQVLKQPLIQVNQPASHPAMMQSNGVGYHTGHPAYFSDEDVRLGYTSSGAPTLFEDTVPEEGDYLTSKRSSHDMKEAVNQSVLLKFPKGGRKNTFKAPDKRKSE